MKPLIVLAHGAGAPSSSAWMLRWAAQLARLGAVVPFDYPYLKQGRRRPDRQPVLVEAHREALAAARRGRRRPIVLAGKSMGGRMSCHVALDPSLGVRAVVCLGYPLRSPGPSRALRDEVLVQSTTPILFVQGTRDALCPLDELAEVRARMSAPSELHVVPTGDHSLLATRTHLRTQGTTQEELEQQAILAIGRFLATHA